MLNATLRVTLTAAVVLPSLLTQAAENPYGVCSHVSCTWGGYAYRDESFRWASAAGFGRVRSDFYWFDCQKAADAPFDFSYHDSVIDSAERCGIRVLPILYGIPKWAEPVNAHLEAFGRYVCEMTRHFGNRLTEVEIWNEENIAAFWKPAPDAKDYFEVLKTAYAAAKRGNPDVRVLFGGTAGVPLGFIEAVYRAGGAKYFDVMNVHPYNHPNAPEGDLDVKLEKLRALMAKYGDAEKPIVITEHGWPTHKMSIDTMMLKTGLKLARPERKSWRTVYAATSAGEKGHGFDAIETAVVEALPPGSSCEACLGARLRERLAAGDVDAVIYPFDESYPVDTVGAVVEFVKRGGTLVDLGGMPMWRGCRETSPGVFETVREDGAADRTKLKIAISAFWIDRNLPESAVKVFPTEAAKCAGYRGDPAGEPADRYQTAAKLGPRDEFVPILVGKDKTGKEAVAASLIRFDGEFKGRVVVSGRMSPGRVGTNDESNQARYLVRSLAIGFAEGVRDYYWYELRSPEQDDHYSEDHFGLMHAQFAPKPAWGAYANFIRRRPAGSVQRSGAWKDGELYFPQWTRPDGKTAGVVWKTGRAQDVALRFKDGKPKFWNHTGRMFRPREKADGSFAVKLDGSPVFFEGAELAVFGTIKEENK